ncbi:hypothetical protein IDSA_05190 [Pseudidiomarina salinarum]|uniref:CAAX prenyl protease 2/Lysostaphin resistance protein A-like domain-containing protein n=1 Tax=Pseudidiomarina salinarum TaxID=435908 RepID=A0A094J1Y1_9GAMM|nr:type II CAAX endopeptidase family protein [Pseudidiomarina salinarum]KFZ32069.1 hypothetical protein IDSA_05190 [Pseudidiomarina salinarum]RUO70152.1 CPBP family intramembrane metalloprotease [Pseudidiomarina salinarum]
MLNSKLAGPWSRKQGFAILISFVVIYFGLSWLSMLAVKYTIGFAALWGDSKSPPAILLTLSQLLKALVILAVIWSLALKRYQVSWSALGFRRVSVRWLYLAAGIAIAGFLLRILLAKVMVFAVPDWAAFAAAPIQLAGTSTLQLILFLVMTVLITPVVEEVFFRGFLFQWMASRHRLWLAALISSVMFGASHIIPPQAISAALMSLLIIYLFVASKSLWPPIVCHIVNNLLSVSGNLLIPLLEAG